MSALFERFSLNFIHMYFVHLCFGRSSYILLNGKLTKQILGIEVSNGSEDLAEPTTLADCPQPEIEEAMDELQMRLFQATGCPP